MWKVIENNILLRSITVFLVTIVLCLFAAVFLLPPLSIILFWRWSVGRAAKLFQKDKLGKLITSTSAVFLASALAKDAFLYTRRSANIVIEFEIESPTLDVPELRDLAEKKILSVTTPNSNDLMYPELKSTFRSWMGFLFWAPCPGFDIKDHVKSITETDAPFFDPQDPTARAGLITYLTRDRIWTKDRKPLWEVILVENAIPSGDGDETKNKSLICFRFHHALGDGWSAVKLLLKLVDNSDALSKMPQFKVQQSVGCKAYLAWAWLWIKLPFITVDHILTVLSNRTKLPIFKAPPSTNNDDPDVFGMSEDVFSLNRFKQLKNKLGVDFHSMIVAGIAAAVRNTYLAVGKQVPEGVLFSFPLPMPGHPDNKLRNHVTVGNILLPIGEPDSLKRVQMISSLVQSGIRSGLPLFNFYMYRVLGCIPHGILCQFRDRGFVNVPPILFTNLVGPSEYIYWEDKRISDVQIAINVPFEGPEGLAYGMGLVSYGGRIKFGVAGLKHYFPDLEHVQRFFDCCVAEWKYLETLEPDENKIAAPHIV